MDSYEHRYILQPPSFDEEDLRQEAELLRLQGIQPSLSILRKKAQLYTEYVYSGDLPAQPITRPSRPSFEVLEALISWASQQDPEVKQLILDFLDDPGEEVLNFTLKELARRQLLSTYVPNREISLSRLILDALKTPREVEELYELARNVGHLSKRPEAAVRQILRRLVREGKVAKTGTQYLAINTNDHR